MDGREQPYRPDIDGLRAVAVLAVVAFHAFPQWLPGGFIGVDVFFVISGFLISGQLMAAASRGTFSLTDFYARRIRRIFPALIVVLTATALAGWWLLLPDEWAALSGHIAASAIFANNLLLWSGTGYFDGPSELKPLLHLWSLGVEEQFYLIWPLLILSCWKLNLRWVTAIAAIVAASFAINVMHVNDGAASAAFFLPHARLWQLGTGALLAALARGGATVPASRVNNLFSVVGVSLVALTCIAIDRGPVSPNWWSDGVYPQVSAVVGWIARVLWLDGADRAYPGWSALAPTVGAALVIAAGPHAWWNRGWLAARPMVFIGLISYPLYLWHWPILSFLQITELGEVSRPVTAAAITLAIVLAVLTYLLVERPTRRALSIPTPWRIVPLATSLGVIGVVMLLSMRLGWSTPQARTATEIDQAVPNGLHQTECRRRYPNASEYCQQFDRALPITTAILGDSHAAHFFPGLGAILQARGLNLVHLGHTGCPPLLNIERVNESGDNACVRVNAAVLEAVAGDRAITEVWLSFRGAMAVEGEGFGPDSEPPGILFRSTSGDAHNGAAIDQGLRKTIVFLQSRGKRVGVMLQVPELGFRVDSCTGRPVSLAHRPARTPCGIPSGVMRRRQARYRDMIAMLQREYGVQVYDPAEALCDSELCHAVADGRMLYHDDNHLGVFGSAWSLRRFEARRTSEADQAPGDRPLGRVADTAPSSGR